MMKIRSNSLLSWLLLAVLLIVAFEPRRGPGTRVVADVAKAVRAKWLHRTGWPQIRDGASIVRGTPATVSIVMFTDYECPFCAAQDAALDSLKDSHPTVGVALRHVVRPGSVRGRTLALTALCAVSTEAWPQLNSALYELARTPQETFRTQQATILEQLLPGRAATVVACSESPPAAIVRRLQRDSTLMAQLQLEATPTLLGRRMKLVGLRSLAELREVVPHGGSVVESSY